MSRTGSEPGLVGYLKRIVPQALSFACIAALGALVHILPNLSAALSDAAAFLSVAAGVLVLGFAGAVLRDAWS